MKPTASKVFLLLLAVLLLAVWLMGGCVPRPSLVIAAKQGNTDKVKAMLAEGPSDLEKAIALMRAAENGHTDVVKMLIEHGVDVNSMVEYRYGTHALIMATSWEHADTARYLVEAGADVNVADQKYGMTPLMYAASGIGLGETAKLLIEHGADVKARAVNGSTALMEAANKGHTQVTRLLLESGAEVDAEIYDDGTTALLFALAGNHTETAKLLIEAGADVNARRTKDGVTALMVAANMGTAEVVKMLVEHGADVDARDTKGFGALIQAAQGGHQEIVDFLINRVKRYSLIEAAAAGLTEEVGQLLKKGADVHATDSEGATPLIWAARGGHTDAAKLLIEHHADINAKAEETERKIPKYVPSPVIKRAGPDIFSTFIPMPPPSIPSMSWTVLTRDAEAMEYVPTPLMEALFQGHTDTARLLIEHGAQTRRGSNAVTTMMLAAGLGDTELVNLLMEKRVRVDKVDLNGRTALHWAADQGHPDTVNFLLEHGADVNATAHYNVTPLMEAVYGGYVETVKLLIERGADVNATARQSRMRGAFTGTLFTNVTTLVAAIQQYGYLKEVKSTEEYKEYIEEGGPPLPDPDGHMEIIRILIDHGAAEGKGGDAALVYGAMTGGAEIVEMFLDLGIDINAEKNAHTALMAASAAGDIESVRLLIDRGADVNVSHAGLSALTLALKNGHTEIVELLEAAGAKR